MEDKIEYRVGCFKIVRSNDVGTKLKFSHYVTESCGKEAEGLEHAMWYHNEKSSPTRDYLLVRITNGNVFHMTKGGRQYIAFTM